ncbi:MAG: cupredoxin domain-containing protein [Planctomycetota bacterium]
MKYRAFVLTILCILFSAGTALARSEKLFEVKAKKFVYTPNVIKVDKGDLVRIRLISEDVTHGLFVDGYNVQTSAYPGQDGSITFVADKAGRFTFRCSVTCGEFHPYMTGYLVVAPNSRFWGYVILTLVIGLGSIAFVFAKNRKEQEDGKG